MNAKLKATLETLEKEVQDRTLALLLKGTEPFVGSLHMEEWDTESWACLVRLALASGLSRDFIADECVVTANEIDRWLLSLSVPDVRVRQTVIRLVLGREAQAAA